MKNNGNMATLLRGILKENPVLVLILGTCPTLATTTTVTGAIGMGLAALVVLLCSNIFISLLRKISYLVYLLVYYNELPNCLLPRSHSWQHQ